ncbi:MAG: cytochrome C biogenesis protein [Rhizobiales bacterium 24-66-13]|jgi:cytochrome c-type biogenesis protein|uniref:cytochrome c biogenesis CcdA family protein n=1 Tax=Roseixanthobacter finlandensis TaxID=3119922 RepID=UPI000BD2D91E|nr:MAG: cytochrome C biogenesis protein [Rhizobiales bacterium 35-66-30]OYZ68718.1 MAG: cytochrome C biogenesis protein [Rhizobiales bacterium 24-66-13]OZB06797.1 MAG: cytochrome C biogenesis protein [Rhizobiales bacterium 39-66-18]HQS08645.1 cytochrome c biogenesis protein CcdA [Xanthobacteraceae bacterium]HQS49986.1 cytochrome c biogenesis protein CcdA [Xanthobacteraceae bacterium]
MADVTLPAAFAAGLASFLSPCVLPLVPPYLCFLGGATLEDLSKAEPLQQVGRRAIFGALLFVSGFTVVFVALGAGASAVGEVLRAHQEVLSIIAGVAIIVMGLNFLGVFKIHLLSRTARPHVNEPTGLWGAFVMGLAFAFGWTPCLGPVLGAILAVAGSEATVAKGAGLLAIYSAGLGVPFLLAAVAVRPFLDGLRHMRRLLPVMEKVMGAMLVLTGIAFMSGWIASVSYWLIETFPALSTIG